MKVKLERVFLMFYLLVFATIPGCELVHASM